MSNRTDCHRPGAIVPSNYAHVIFYALPDHNVPGDRGLNVDFVRKLYTDETPREFYGAIGKCGVCGACFKYGELWRHVPTGDLVHLGHECAHKYELVADMDDWSAELESLKARRAAYIQGQLNARKRDQFLARHEGLREALETDHYIVRDIASRFRQWHEISEKQVALVMKLAGEAGERAARPAEVNVPAPISDKRQTIEGVVVSVKDQETAYGITTRATIKVTTPEGVWLCWGTVPHSDAKRGDVVKFDAKLEAGKDAHFAFFKRPTKASIVRAAEGQPEGRNPVVLLDGTTV